MPHPEAIVSRASKLVQLESDIGAMLRGKPEVVRLALVCLLARGHLLIEDVPGVGKTTLAQALARSVDCGFHRLQCTSDMLPGDILGVTVYSAKTGEFEFKRGPIFTNFLLADEINRATPKTQSALLEAMNERQITIDAQTMPLTQPFLVVATQNPVEHHGTYPLPESQLDRFLMRVKIGYPSRDSERAIIRNHTLELASQMPPSLSRDELIDLQHSVESTRVDETLVEYMLDIASQTRAHDQLSLGVSPRAAQSLYRASQALALLEGRDYVIPDDIKRLAVPVFAHRIVLHQRSGLAARSTESAERVIEHILNHTEVPL